MRHISTIGLLLAVGACLVFSCAKYKSTVAKTPIDDTTHYCNDPNAVNYNWGFPGIPDSTVCFYPTDVFAGVYIFHDSIYLTSTGLFVRADTLILTMAKVNDTDFTIAGFCVGGQIIKMKAGIAYTATIDTDWTISDSASDIFGQLLCGQTTYDTIEGSMNKNPLNDSIMYITFTVSSDTGVFTNHNGTARLIHK